MRDRVVGGRMEDSVVRRSVSVVLHAAVNLTLNQIISRLKLK